MNENTPVFNWEAAVDFIAERCEFSKDIIENILELEEEYMQSVGIIVES